METIFQWVSQYGYLGLFLALVLGIVGLPIPDETLLTFAGWLVYRGRLHLVPALSSAFLGSLCGITLSYTLGRTFGLYLIHRYGRYLHVTDEKLERVHRWFRRAGRWTLTFGYFLPGIRHLTAYVAGASKLEFPVFGLFAYSGGLLWSSTFISLGYSLGDEWARAGEKIQHHLALGFALVFVLAAVYFLLRRRKSGRT
jgi:membrane protein DedA with SNARE-associated domain